VTSPIHEDLMNRLTSFYFAGNASTVLVMTKFCKVKPELFEKNILELYSKDPTSLTRILAFVHELKVSSLFFIYLFINNRLPKSIQRRYCLRFLICSPLYLRLIWLL
jgi:hypothetical protein